MAENGGEPVLDRVDDALRLGLSVELEATVHTRDHKVEAREHLVRIIQRAVGQNVRFNAFQNAKIDEDTNASLFLIAPTTQRVVGALQNKTLSVRGALANAPDFWIVELAPDWDVRKFWKVGLSDLEEDFLPNEGLGIVPLKSSAADFIEQAVSFFSARFTGENLTESRIPFLRFKTIVDDAYNSFRKIFPPPVVNHRSLTRSLDFDLFQPKFSSLIIAIDRPRVDVDDARREAKTDELIDPKAFATKFD